MILMNAGLYNNAGMLCSLHRTWRGNCRYNATALQSIQEITHDNGGDSWGDQAAGYRVNLIKKPD